MSGEVAIFPPGLNVIPMQAAMPRSQRCDGCGAPWARSKGAFSCDFCGRGCETVKFIDVTTRSSRRGKFINE